MLALVSLQQYTVCPFPVAVPSGHHLAMQVEATLQSSMKMQHYVKETGNSDDTSHWLYTLYRLTCYKV